MANKGVSKAAGEVVSDGFREVDQEIMAKLRQLHPPEEAYVSETGCVWPGLTKEDDGLIREVVKQFLDAYSQLLPKLLQDQRMGLLQIDLKNAFN